MKKKPKAKAKRATAPKAKRAARRKPTPTDTPARTGRPSKLTIEIAARICDLVAKGNYLETVTKMLGIGKSTFYEWIAAGRADIEAGKDETDHARLVEALERSNAVAEIEKVELVRIGVRNWQAAAWWLERRFPSRWGRRVLEVSGLDGKPIQSEVKVHVAEPARAVAILAILRSAGVPLDDGGPGGGALEAAAEVHPALPDGSAGRVPVPAAP